jgi:hypothetical protein
VLHAGSLFVCLFVCFRWGNDCVVGVVTRLPADSRSDIRFSARATFPQL